MRGAAGVHVDLEVRETLHERAGRAGMVQMDVGQEQGARLLGEAREQRLHPALGARVDDRSAQVPCADHPFAALLEHVDELGLVRHLPKAIGAPPLNSHRELQ